MSNPLGNEIDDLRQKLGEAQEKYRLLSAQHARLCDSVYEDDGETLKIEAVKQQLGALELSILDGSHPNLMLERAELATKARECAEAQVALAKERAEVDRLNHWLAAGAVAVQEAIIAQLTAVEQQTTIGEIIQLVNNLNLDPLTAGRELLEHLKRDTERLDWWQQFIDAAERDLGVKCGVYVTENGEVQIGELQRWWSTDIRAAIDAAIAAGGSND